jgi:hypothetical protein
LTDIVEKTSRMQRRSRHQTSRSVVDLCRNDEFIEVSPTANVVVATGPYQLASVPPCSAMLPLSIHRGTARSHTWPAGKHRSARGSSTASTQGKYSLSLHPWWCRFTQALRFDFFSTTLYSRRSVSLPVISLPTGGCILLAWPRYRWVRMPKPPVGSDEALRPQFSSHPFCARRRAGFAGLTG